MTSGFLSLEEVGRLAGGGTRSNDSLSRLAVFDAWSRAVGPTLRAVTRPSRYAQGLLVVEVISAVWRTELERLRAEILDRLAHLLPSGAVSAVAYSLRPGLSHEPRRSAGVALESIEVAPQKEDHVRWEGSGLSILEATIRDDDLRRRYSEVSRRYPRSRA